MQWPGEQTIIDWIESYSDVSKSEKERLNNRDQIWNFIYEYTKKRVFTWWKKNNFARLPLNEEIEDYYHEVATELYKAVLSWYYKGTIRRRITKVYLGIRISGLCKGKLLADKEEEHRRQSHREGIDLEEDGGDFINEVRNGSPEPEEFVITLESFKRGLGRLTERQRIILKKYFSEERTLAEIAAELGVDTSTIGRELKRIEAILRDEMM